MFFPYPWNRGVDHSIRTIFEGFPLLQVTDAILLIAAPKRNDYHYAPSYYDVPVDFTDPAYDAPVWFLTPRLEKDTFVLGPMLGNGAVVSRGFRSPIQALARFMQTNLLMDEIRRLGCQIGWKKNQQEPKYPFQVIALDTIAIKLPVTKLPKISSNIERLVDGNFSCQLFWQCVEPADHILLCQKHLERAEQLLQSGRLTTASIVVTLVIWYRLDNATAKGQLHMLTRHDPRHVWIVDFRRAASATHRISEVGNKNWHH